MSERNLKNSTKSNFNSNSSTTNLKNGKLGLSNTSRIKSSGSTINKKKGETNPLSNSVTISSSLKKKFGSGTPHYSFGSSVKTRETFLDYMDPSKSTTSKSLKSLPGPGEYDPNTNKLKRQPSSWSLAGKQKYEPRNVNPGPGTYNISSTPKGTAPSTKFGSAKKEFTLIKNLKERKNSPGPGQYQTTKAIGTDARKFKFGNEIKFCNKRPATPGPGKYDSDKVNTIESVAKKKLGPRITSTKSASGNDFTNTIYRFNNNPGPAAYNTITPHKTKGPSIGSAKRKDGFLEMGTNSSPGPGLYKVKSSINDAKAYKFSKDAKLKPVKSISPGPGLYDV